MRLLINITIGCITIMGCAVYDPPKDAILVQNYSPYQHPNQILANHAYAP